jgi:hypothetical protein
MYRLIFTFAFFYFIVFNTFISGQDIYSHFPTGSSINDCINRNRIVKNKILKCIETEFRYDQRLGSLSEYAKHVYEYGAFYIENRKELSINLSDSATKNQKMLQGKFVIDNICINYYDKTKDIKDIRLKRCNYASSGESYRLREGENFIIEEIYNKKNKKVASSSIERIGDKYVQKCKGYGFLNRILMDKGKTVYNLNGFKISEKSNVYWLSMNKIDSKEKYVYNNDYYLLSKKRYHKAFGFWYLQWESKFSYDENGNMIENIINTRHKKDRSVFKYSYIYRD